MSKILESIEAGLYDAALWLVLIPKTLIKTMTDPKWTKRYVAEQVAKPADQRFDEYMAPVLFFFLGGVLPAAPLVNAYLRACAAKGVATEFYSNVAAQSTEIKLLCFAVFAATGPLSVAVVTQRFRGNHLGRSQLRAVFLPQMYLFGSCYGASVLALVGSAVVRLARYGPFLAILTGGWLLWAEVELIASYLDGSRRRAWAVIAIAYVLFLLLMFLAETIILLGLGGLPRWLLQNLRGAA